MAYRRRRECHLCDEPAIRREGSTQCAICKAKTCGPCFELQSDHMRCKLCSKVYCTSCYTIHDMADCDDCGVTLCTTTNKTHIKRHKYCAKCEKYKCFKLPPSSLKRHLKRDKQHIFSSRCSKCLWPDIQCYICKNQCKTCPYECHKCHAPVCEDCKSRGRLSNETHLCQVCEFHEANSTMKLLRDNYKKAKIAFALKTMSPTIGRYVALFLPTA